MFAGSAEAFGKSGSPVSVRLKNEHYRKAVDYYKKACAAKVYEGCWNIGVIYQSGLGETRSRLAAAEWFYKAGVGYLAINERERALGALEAVQSIDFNGLLAKKLSLELQKGAPK
jgi:hypothetical protein